MTYGMSIGCSVCCRITSVNSTMVIMIDVVKMVKVIFKRRYRK